MRAARGTLTEPGRNSPYRDRTVEENLDLFRRMRAGEFPNGARVLRAKIDMACGNINLRDPVLYRILHDEHPRTGKTWCIYPSYDFAHGQSDAIEGITHSMCTLEFEDHRPLYDWFLANLPVPSQPHQYEFARLNLAYTVLSKRVLTELVRDGHVTAGTIRACRRLRACAGAACRRRRSAISSSGSASPRRTASSTSACSNFRSASISTRPRSGAWRCCGRSRSSSKIIRKARAKSSRPSTIRKIRQRARAGIRFGREIFIERDDFMEDPPKKFFRLSPGTEVRLRYAYFITCREVVKNAAGDVVELRCTYDPATKGGNAPDGRKVKATMHWVSAEASRAGGGAPLQSAVHASPIRTPAISPPISIRIRSKSSPMRGSNRRLAETKSGEPVQFERQGYFCPTRIPRPAGWCSIAPSAARHLGQNLGQ